MVLYLTENILEEAVSSQEVINALEKRNGIVITYNDDTKTARVGRRYIEPYVYGLTKAGNPCIRAYQYYGDTKRGVPKWKLFRLDRIESWEPTQETFELEPQARGWVAQAYNDNGDNSMSAIYKTVDLQAGNEMTDLDKLRAKTRQLKNSKPLNINQFKDRLQYPEERNRQARLQAEKNQEQKPTQPGPINSPEPNSQNKPSPVQDTSANNVSNPLNGNGQVETNVQQPPIQKEPNKTGPVIDKPEEQSIPDVQKATPDELMSNDKFQQMLKRNLEITNQEKQKRQSWKNNRKR